MKYLIYITLAVAMSFVSCSKEELSINELQKATIEEVFNKLILAKENTENNGVWGNLYHNLLPNGKIQKIFIPHKEYLNLKSSVTGTLTVKEENGGAYTINCEYEPRDCRINSNGSITHFPLPGDFHPGD